MRHQRVHPGASRPVRLVVACVCSGALLMVGACATTVPGSPGADSDEVSLYSSEQSASAVAAQRESTVALCRQAMSSMVVMVRGYNTFVDKLNDVQSYDRVGDLDDRARASLIAGADQIRAEVAASIPATVTDPVNAFLASSDRLGQAIARRELVGLNPIADTWTRDKQSVLTVCAEYLPTPPGLSGVSSAAATPTPTR